MEERYEEHFSMRLPPMLKNALRAEAARRFTTPAALVRQAVAREIGLLAADARQDGRDVAQAQAREVV